MHRDSNHIPPAHTGSYPAREGCSFTPLVDGPAAFGRIAEAVEKAQHSIWLTVAFIEKEFRFPGDRGSLFDLLDSAATRGMDVRVLFWREPNLDDLVSNSQAFAGTNAERAELRARNFRGKIRWDALPDFCHHQKSWVIDANHENESAFVGGINLDRGSLSPPGHLAKSEPEDGVVDLYREIHDLYSEIRGPAVTDVVHNFVQRWNEASERNKDDGSYPDQTTADDLARPTELSPPRGDTAVQITRTIMPGIYVDGTPPPGGVPYPIADGEASVREQVRAAIANAQRTIHIENQVFLSRAILADTLDALARGVRVIAVVPTNPMPELVQYRRRAPEASAPIFDLLAKCGEHDNFTLAGLAKRTPLGRLVDVYVHAKIMLVDDAWGTIGSTNFMGRSFHQETEMNASFWCPTTARQLRQDLFAEHLAGATSELAEVAAFDRFAVLARDNHPRFAAGEELVGLAHALAPEKYCL